MNTITDAEFARFQQLIFRTAGISLSPAKKALVCGRLGKRLQQRGFASYAEYFRCITGAGEANELQLAVDLLTTNETYFFREPKHFELLRRLALAAREARRPLRVWSAASSSGEEAYSSAMVLADCLGDAPWEVLGSDISTRVLERARVAQYPLERARLLPAEYLKRFCLKGTGRQQGTLLVSRELRKRVQFRQVNLNAPLPGLGEFDLIFLRNVMIYFNNDTKREVVGRMLPALKPGGCFVIGHSENLNGITDLLESVAPSVYRRP
ncbi:MAG TPA: CheR family methyltransferase [Burkholderiales bacterium]|nr:CheR family methyltransferase [Burkholderiales bacterium]